VGLAQILTYIKGLILEPLNPASRFKEAKSFKARTLECVIKKEAHLLFSIKTCRENLCFFTFTFKIPSTM